MTVRVRIKVRVRVRVRVRLTGPDRLEVDQQPGALRRHVVDESSERIHLKHCTIRLVPIPMIRPNLNPNP